MIGRTRRFATLAFPMMAFIAARASGQTERVLRFAHTEAQQSMAETSMAIKTIVDAPTSLDSDRGTLTINGAPEQLALAEWMFVQLDQPQAPASSQSDSTVHEYLLKGGDENAIRVFSLQNPTSDRDFQEIATVVRAITEIRRTFTTNASRAIMVRGTPDQVGLASWIVDALDRPEGGKAATPEYRLPESGDPHGEVLTRVFHVANAETVRDFQEIAVMVRNLTDIHRTFTVNTPRAILVRGTPEAVALADWLVQQVDKPGIGKAGGPVETSSPVYKYDTRFDPWNTVKVLYRNDIANVDDFRAVLARVITATASGRVAGCDSSRAIAVRGTVDQVEMAERAARPGAGSHEGP